MATARDMMHQGAECVGEHETLADAARKMRDLNIGSMPICGEDQRLKGIITDRDIVVRCVAEGGDPTTVTARELATGTPIWVDAGADHQEVVRLLMEHKIRRLPVIDEHQLVGMISEADVARHLPEQEISDFARAVYSAPPSS
ncbi:MAG TPA: CBS domain-containing protein [Natronosporangium sp.]